MGLVGDDALCFKRPVIHFPTLDDAKNYAGASRFFSVNPRLIVSQQETGDATKSDDPRGQCPMPTIARQDL